jgi:hypothetical protein
MATSISAQILVSPQDIFSSSATQGTGLGVRATLGDGRVFRYALAGATALVVGDLQQASAEDTTNYQNLAVTAAAIGATSIVTTTTATVTANALAGGYLCVTTSAGIGNVYQIGGNTAATGAVFTITLNDPLLVALTTGSRIDLIPNTFASVIINPASASSAPVGVAVYPTTAAQYGWLQTQGVAPVLNDAGTVTVGTTLVASNATAGAVEALTGVQAIVGLAITGIAANQVGLINLNLA